MPDTEDDRPTADARGPEELRRKPRRALHVVYCPNREWMGAVLLLPEDQSGVLTVSLAGPSGARTARELPADRPVLVGRQGALQFPGDTLLSRSHCTLSLTGGALAVTDAGSKHGTFVCGAKLTSPRVLSHQDVVRVGDTLLVYEEEAAEDALFAIEEGGDRAVDEFAGRSFYAQGIRQRVRRVAPSRGRILLLGQSGAGKTALSRALHRLSGRPGDFVEQSCANLAPALLDSTLSGHRKGAFTGAIGDAAGMFHAAAEGTLLLDEIGDLPKDQQPGLLWSLDTPEGDLVRVRRVGSTKVEQLNVRVIAATNRDVTHVELFRADLLQRVNGYEIRLHPLAGHRADIVAIAERYYHARYGGGVPWTADVVEAFLLYSWPGSVRELEKLLDRMTVDSEGGSWGSALLPAPLRAPVSAGALAKTADALGQGPSSKEPPSSKEELESALSQHKGNVAAVARFYDVGPEQVRRWIRRFGISVEVFR